MTLRAISPARRKRMVLWLGLFALVCGMIWTARHVLLPYILGLVMAYILWPMVNWLDRKMPERLHRWRIARPLAILVTYLLLLALIAGVFAFFVPLVLEQARILIDNWPSLVARMQDWGSRGWGWYQETIPTDWRQTLDTNIRTVVDDAIDATKRGLITTLTTVFSTISFLIGLIVIPFWLFYILHDESKVKTGLLETLPHQFRADAQCISRLIDDVLSAYIRGQLLLCVFVGGLATISLLLLDVPFALILGVIAGILEALPYIGPILGAVPAIVVALLSNPGSAVWVTIAFVAIQQIENLILVPRIAGESVKLHPAIVMVVLVVGNELAGLLGMLVAVPVTAVIRDTFKYLYLRFLDEPLSPLDALANIRTGQEVQLDM